MRILVLLVVLSLSAFADAKVPIDKKHYVANKANGYCGWCSLKVLFQHHKLQGVADVILEDELRLGGGQPGQRYSPQTGWQSVILPPGGATPDKVTKRLDSYIAAGHEFSYEMQQPGDKSLDMIERAVKNDLGCVISIGNGRHAVTLVDISEEECDWDVGGKVEKDRWIEYVDNNDVMSGRRETRTMALSYFTKHAWDGWVVVVKPGKSAKPVKPAKKEPVFDQNTPPKKINPPTSVTPIIRPKPGTERLKPDVERPRVDVFVAPPAPAPRTRLDPKP